MIFIGTLRRWLMLPGSWKWNAWVRDITARYEGTWLIRSSLVLVILFAGAFTASAQCIATPADPCVQVNQSLLDRSAKAAAELIEARKVIASFMAERTAWDAERQAAAKLIERLNAVIAAQDRLTDTHNQMLGMWKDLNAEKDRLIAKYEVKLNAPKTPWQRFLDALKTVATIAVGIGIGRSL